MLTRTALATIGVLVCSASLPAAEDDALPRVSVSHPISREVRDFLDSTGRVEASESLAVRTRISGEVTKIHARRGASVQRGEALAELDARLLQAELTKAQAELKRSEAQVKFAAAALERFKQLNLKGAITQEDLRRAEQDKITAEGALDVARASTEVARIKLSYTKIFAPISGKVGKWQVSPGSVIAEGALLTNLVRTDFVRVAFNVDERTALELLRQQARGKRSSKKDLTFDVQVGLIDEKDFPHQAKVSFADFQVNPGTGTARLEAAFANPEGLFRPGMSARVRVLMSPPYKALLVLREAVRQRTEDNPRANYVFVVTAKNEVEIRKVTLGSHQDDNLFVVTEGLKKDDLVVVEKMTGLLRTKVEPVTIPMPRSLVRTPLKGKVK